MSFSLLVKQEIASTPLEKKCCILAEISAFIRTNGSMELGNDGIKVRFDVERIDTANRICAIIKKIYDVELDILKKQDKRLGKAYTYSIKVDSKQYAKELLKDTGVLLQGDEGYDIETRLPKNLLRLTCCQRAYLKGAFQGSGSVCDPKKEYRLEFASRDEETDAHIRMILHSKEIPFNSCTRREWCILYITDAENIIKILALLGAHKNLLDMENVIVLKGIRNDINRKVNLETANLRRISYAAKHHIDAINKLMESGEFDTLPQKIKQAAYARIENKEANLEELAHILDISKSGANHRMRKIVEYANEKAIKKITISKKDERK